MRIKEFSKNSTDFLQKSLTKVSALYESLPIFANKTREEPIFNANKNSEFVQSHRRRNTLVYQKLKNWD